MEPLRSLHTALDLTRYHANGWALAYVAGAAVVALMLFLVLTNRAAASAAAPRRAFAINMSLVAFMLITVGAVIAAHDEPQAEAIARLGMGVAWFIGPSTVHFVCRLVGWRRQLAFPRAAMWVTSAAMCFITFSTTWMVSGAYETIFGYAARAGWMTPIGLFHLFICMLVALGVAFVRMRATTSPVERLQLRYVIIAYALGNLTFLDLLPAFGFIVVPSSYLWLTLSSLVLTYAVRAHHLLGVPELGWRALGWVFTSALFTAFAVAILWIADGWPGWGDPLSSAAALFTMFLLMRVHLAGVQPRIDDLFLRRRRDLDRELDELSDRLLVLHTASEIAVAVSALLSRTLYVKLVAFAVRDVTWRVVHSAWGSVPPPDDDDPFVRALAGKTEPVTRSDSGDRMFARYGAEVIVPLAVGEGELVGLIAVGPRPDAQPFLPYEVDFLARLRAVVAAPLDAARLYDRRHRLRAELEQKVAARSADLARALANLQSAQSQLVQSEKMATLGVVVAGVAAELEAAVDEVHANVPGLAANTVRLDEAASAALANASPEVLAWARKAKLDFVRKDIRPLVDAVAEGARRARVIAGDLRRFARADTAVVEPVDLHRELDAILNLIGHELRDRVEVERDLDTSVPLVECDRGPVGQVFMNLLVNAAQAIDGPGKITIRTRAEGDHVEVAVRDTGKGIPEENLPRIFEPFFTTKSLGTRGGTGLGLSISYGIVERHGGRISVSSEPGKGTEFRVTLPVKARRPSVTIRSQ